MLEQYVTSKAYITRKILASDFDECMVQDAMAIILFPQWDSSSDYSTSGRAHFNSWVAHQLPNPIKAKNGRMIDQLGKLHASLLLFIEDYLTKATAVFPPREYLCLPHLSPTRSDLMFRGQTVNTRFDTDYLTQPERERLLRAFLRYECICRMRYPRREYQDPWDDELFCRYGNKRFHESDREAIQCVYRYVVSLYGAMFAQSSDAWLPDMAATSLCSDPMGALHTGLLYPDSLYVNASVYVADIGLGDSYVEISSSLAYFGFDLASTFLRCAISGPRGRDSVKSWFRDLCNPERQQRRAFDTPPFDGPCLGRFPHYIKDENYQEGPGMYQVLYPRVAGSFTLHLNMYRQRAWVFFDDARFYPSGAGPHFPSLDELDKQSGEITLDEEWFKDPGRTRALRRSQKWHDERCGRSSDDGQNVVESQGEEVEMECVALLPSALEKGGFRNLVSFWR